MSFIIIYNQFLSLTTHLEISQNKESTRRNTEPVLEITLLLHNYVSAALCVRACVRACGGFKAL